MPPFGVVKHFNVIEHILSGFIPICINLHRIRSRLSNWKKLSATALSWQLPRRLMLPSRPCVLRNALKSWLVYWLPWSECTITVLDGLRRQTAINNASNTSSLVIRDCIDQPTTFLECKSTTTVRYNQPSWVRIWVISVTHAVLGCVTLNWLYRFELPRLSLLKGCMNLQ